MRGVRGQRDRVRALREPVLREQRGATRAALGFEGVRVSVNGNSVGAVGDADQGDRGPLRRRV